MEFNLQSWQAGVRRWWVEQAPRLSIESAYAALATSAWLPFFAAYAQDPGTAVQALAGITAGIGGNLVANVIQNRYDRTRAGEQSAAQARTDAGVQAELEAVLQATGAMQAAQEELGARWGEFAQQLREEIAALPAESRLLITHSEVGGSVVGGDVKLKGGSIFVGRDYSDLGSRSKHDE